MGFRFFRRPPAVVVAAMLGLALLSSTVAMASDERLLDRSAALAQTPTTPSTLQATAVIVPSNPVAHPHPATVVPDTRSSKASDQEQALQAALLHSSLGRKALDAGDREKAQGELEVSVKILTGIPEAAAPDSLRLRLIEETAALKAALTAASPDKAGAAEETEEDETDLEESPDLVNPAEVPVVKSPEPTPDSIAELDFSQFDVPIVLNENVKQYITFFQIQKSKVIRAAFDRSGRYLQMVRQIFQEQGLPLDLANLAYIESAYNYRAYSRAKAMGLWQFIKSTGQRFHLKVTKRLDERRDPERATEAAAAYLKELYGMFGDWSLALAAYNAGEQRVQRAIDRQGTRDFWSLRLPRETQGFVPAFMAITIISKDHKRYGFDPPVEKPWEVERVKLPAGIQLNVIARVVGVSSDELRELNAAIALRKNESPVTLAESEIYVPLGSKDVLLAKLDQLPRTRYREVVHTAPSKYRVKTGDTLRRIAARYHTTPAALAGLNGMKIGDTLRAGVALQIPQGKRSSASAVAAATSSPPRAAATSTSPTSLAARSPVHIVKRGDTLWGIAKAYAVTPDDLRRWNDLRQQAKIQPGQPLRVLAQTGKNGSETGNGSSPSLTKVRYRVKRGDTLWEIARAHDVTLEDLRRWNDLAQHAKLRVGQQLTIHIDRS